LSEQGHTRWRDDLPAHLLGALPAEEAGELEAHLETCESCRNELRWLRPVIEVLSDSVERVEPPTELRERLMAEVRDDARRAAEAKPARRPLAERMRAFMLRPATALAATAVIGAGVAGYVISDEGGDSVTTISDSGLNQPGVSAMLERKGDSGTLELAGLRQLRSAEVYQAWVQHGKRIQPSSLFEARRDGTASAAIPRDLDGADAVMVTIEPRGGSDEPTSDQLVSVALDG
jgi:anti-sigma-K factor RskA